MSSHYFDSTDRNQRRLLFSILYRIKLKIESDEAALQVGGVAEWQEWHKQMEEEQLMQGWRRNDRYKLSSYSRSLVTESNVILRCVVTFYPSYQLMQNPIIAWWLHSQFNKTAYFHVTARKSSLFTRLTMTKMLGSLEQTFGALSLITASVTIRGDILHHCYTEAVWGNTTDHYMVHVVRDLQKMRKHWVQYK